MAKPKQHKKHVYRDYAIYEDHWIIGNNVTWATFNIYDDEGEPLHEANTLNKAKDWIDAEQAGEHDR
jgi:hypothetical protein